ncbi:MAG: hypothetical protein K2X86_07455 [Cytophagaceae bacterium]|nr:hypothetical protein [Cytophagaceae bacterium]
MNSASASIAGTSSASTSDKINWAQLGSLAALNAAIVISWIAYHNYQPQLLQKFNFTDLAIFLVVAQAIVMVIIPPVAGMVGDYMIRKNSDYFVVFTIGISITAMVFMAVAATISTEALQSARALLPFLIVIWLISMNIFHSPANSMIELFAPGKQLPLAMGVIALITELLMALEPVVIYIVDFLGATATFVTGGVLLVITGYFFRKTTKNVKLRREGTEEEHKAKNNFPVVIVAGLVFGIASAIVKTVFPDVLSSKLSGMGGISDGNIYVCIILAISALCALPMSMQVEKVGVKKFLLSAMVLAFLSICLVFISSGILTAIACVLIGISFSAISVAAFPFALYNLSAKDITYGTGIFFGSVELAGGILNIYYI